MAEAQSSHGETSASRIGRFLGPVVAILVWSISQWATAGLSPEGQLAAGIALWMAIWWMTEAIPLPVTAMLPIVLFPLAGILSIEDVTQPYANRYVFLFLGGFMIARAIERWNLHRRLALLTVLAVGTQPRRLVAGFMLATALLSMWISNTAATVVMLPIGMSLVGSLQSHLKESGGKTDSGSNFATCLMLSIAYSASIGGLATLIGTPTNLFLAKFALDHGIKLSFARWMMFATPFSMLMLVLSWVVLTRIIFPIRIEHIEGGRELIRKELREMGPTSRAEWTVLAVFLSTATAWVLREPITNWEWLTSRVAIVGRLNDTVIAMIGVVLLFVLPVNRRGTVALDWKTANTIPWGMLLLFGGGFALAAGIADSQLADWIGSQVQALDFMPSWLLVAVVVTIVVFLTELTSNTPTVAVFLPILLGVAVGVDVEPMLLLVPATLSATCAFMLPVATPPNAIVFGSGSIAISDMVKAGLVLNTIAIVLIPIWTFFFGP